MMTAEDLIFISVGSAAAKIALHAVTRSQLPMRTLILDTEDATLECIPPTPGVKTSIFGTKRLEGRGTGTDRRLGEGALRDDFSEIMTQIGTPRLAILLTCCGGGTSAATRLLLEGLREQGIATICFATMPFQIEGDDVRQNAAYLLPSLEQGADALTRIPLDSLVEDLSSNLSLDELFTIVANRISTGLTVFWTLLLQPSFFVFDIERLRCLLMEEGRAGIPFYFADAEASGENRAQEAIESILKSKRFHRDGNERLSHAAQVLVGVLAGDDLRLCELTTIMDRIKGHCTSLKESFLGTARLPETSEKLRIVVLAFALPSAEVGEKPSMALPITTTNSGKRPRRSQSKKQLGYSSDCFADVEDTIYGGQNLDVPTYRRRGIRLSR